MTRCFITSKIYNLNPESSWVFHYFRPRMDWDGWGPIALSPEMIRRLLPKIAS